MQRPTLLQCIGLLAAVSLVAGIIVAGMLLPFVGGAGLVARSITNDFANLPSDLTAKPLPQVSKVLAADGSTIATFYSQYRFSVPLSEVPLDMQRAIIDIEDHGFYEHGGIDLKATVRALLRNGATGSVTQGGSTLTQQYVKNVLVENAQTGQQRAAAVADTLARKVREAKYAIELERKLTKEQILERYLNIVYFGDGAYGIGAAARHYFDEPVQNLTLPQSALLAGLVQSPEAYNPRFYPNAAKARRDVVLGQMLKYGAITPTTYDQAIATPVKLHIHQQPNDCVSSKYPYFCDYVKHVFENDPNLGLSLLRRGGLTVQTTLSPKIEKAAEHGIHQYVYAHEPVSHVAGAEALVQPGTGEIKALAVSTPYGNNPKKGENSIDYAVDEKWGGSAGFHAGSTFKLFVLTAALKEGIPLATSIKAPGSLTIYGLQDCAGRPVAPWPVHNDDGGAGTYNLETGTWYSVNTFFAQLEQRTGVCQPVKLAEAMGIQQGTGKPPEQIGPFVLGGGAEYGFTPLDLAGAYATMAAHGEYCTPIAITSIVDRSGQRYQVPKSHCDQVVPAGLANTVTAILEGVLTRPGATGAGLALSGRPAAAKTGTLDNNVGSWFAGYTPQLASAVWVGNPKAPTRSLNGLPIGSTSYGAVFGATIAGPIWKATMDAALAGTPVEQFTGPDQYYTIGVLQTVPDVTGDTVTVAAAALRQQGFSPALSRHEVNSTVPAGEVAMTNPVSGSQAPQGSTVVLVLSNGIAPSPTGTPTATPSGSPPTQPGNGITSTPTPPAHGPKHPPPPHH